MKKPQVRKEVTKTNDPIAFLQHVALAWNFAKLQSPALDREKWFLHELKNINALSKEPTIKKITSAAIATACQVSYVFDQYFFFMFGKMPCAFSHPKDEKFIDKLYSNMKN